MEGWSLTDLFEGQTVKLLPSVFQDGFEAAAFCHALDKAVLRLKPYIDSVCIWPAIDRIDNNLADYLAVELRTPFYNQSFPIETKRGMIAKTLIWYSRLGTSETVIEIVEAVFGFGQVSQWYEYGGNPYCFRVYSSNPLAAPEDAKRFRAILAGVKNTRSWLDNILILRTWGDVHGQNADWAAVLGLNTWGDIFNKYPTWGDMTEDLKTWGRVYGANKWGNVYGYVWEESDQ
jgi:hypothetical protein